MDDGVVLGALHRAAEEDVVAQRHVLAPRILGDVGHVAGGVRLARHLWLLLWWWWWGGGAGGCFGSRTNSRSRQPCNTSASTGTAPSPSTHSLRRPQQQPHQVHVAEDRLQQRALAGADAADDGDELARRDAELGHAQAEGARARAVLEDGLRLVLWWSGAGLLLLLLLLCVCVLTGGLRVKRVVCRTEARTTEGATQTRMVLRGARS